MMNSDLNLGHPGRRTTILELLTIIIIGEFHLNFYVAFSMFDDRFPRLPEQ